MDESSLLLRQIPHSIEAEQSVLGAMLIDARCIPDVVEALTGLLSQGQPGDLRDHLYHVQLLRHY